MFFIILMACGRTSQSKKVESSSETSQSQSEEEESTSAEPLTVTSLGDWSGSYDTDSQTLTLSNEATTSTLVSLVSWSSTGSVNLIVQSYTSESSPDIFSQNTVLFGAGIREKILFVEGLETSPTAFMFNTGCPSGNISSQSFDLQNSGLLSNFYSSATTPDGLSFTYSSRLRDTTLAETTRQVIDGCTDGKIDISDKSLLSLDGGFMIGNIDDGFISSPNTPPPGYTVDTAHGFILTSGYTLQRGIFNISKFENGLATTEIASYDVVSNSKTDAFRQSFVMDQITPFNGQNTFSSTPSEDSVDKAICSYSDYTTATEEEGSTDESPPNSDEISITDRDIFIICSLMAEDGTPFDPSDNKRGIFIGFKNSED